jgi:hypothetical protein
MRHFLWRTLWVFLGTLIGGAFGIGIAIGFGQIAATIACLMQGICMYAAALATFGGLMLCIPIGLLVGLCAGIFCPIPRRISN